jgi:hypothetical protein
MISLGIVTMRADTKRKAVALFMAAIMFFVCFVVAATAIAGP